VSQTCLLVVNNSSRDFFEVDLVRFASGDEISDSIRNDSYGENEFVAAKGHVVVKARIFLSLDNEKKGNLYQHPMQDAFRTLLATLRTRGKGTYPLN